MDYTENELLEFKNETTDLLDEAEHLFLSISENPEHSNFPKKYECIFRIFHNLKGSAGMMGQIEMQSIMHNLEHHFLKFKDKKMMPENEITFFLNGIDNTRRALHKPPPKAEPAEKLPVIEEKTTPPISIQIDHKKNPIKSLEWRSEYSLGDQHFDFIHKHLLDCLNQIIAIDHKTASHAPHEFCVMFAEFVGAFKMHCAYEEAVLKKLINNDRALQDHLKEHLACLNLLSEHASDLIKGKVLIARSFLLSIRKLFLDHLTQGDLSMTKLIKKNAS